MDVGCSGFFGIESCSVQDPYNIRGDRSVSGFDLTHVLSASATAPLPFGKGRRFANSGGWFDYIIGNWQLNGILTLTSGLPYNVFISSDIPNVGNFAPWSGNVRANQIGDPNLSNPGIGEWFNTAAFAPPSPFTFGNSGRNVLRGPNWLTLDYSMGKNFKLARVREGMELQLRMDANNIMNHAVFANPASRIGAAGVATITSTFVGSRTVQLGARLAF